MKHLPHIDKMPGTEAEWFDALVRLARFLRSPEGCPWDREHGSMDFARDAQGEATELVQALEKGSDNGHIEEEWGDTLFTVLATVAAAESEGRFTLLGALERAHEKMIRRHGHIFGGYEANSPEEVARVWDSIKEQEQLDKQSIEEQSP